MFILVYVSTLLVIAILLMVIVYIAVNAYFKKMDAKRSQLIGDVLGTTFEVIHSESSGNGEVIVRANDNKTFCFKFNGSYMVHYFETNIPVKKETEKRP